jgi:hypothetical protein
VKRPDIEAIRARACSATAGPWHVRLTDDDMRMNAIMVVTGEAPARHDKTVTFDKGHNARAEETVCVTLLQSPETACHQSDRWYENARFIAAAREDVPALLRYIEHLESHMPKTADGEVIVRGKRVWLRCDDGKGNEWYDRATVCTTCGVPPFDDEAICYADGQGEWHYRSGDVFARHPITGETAEETST